MIKNIIFDFDGVIVDSEVLASKAFCNYFNNLGYSFNEQDFYKYAGMKTIDVINKLSIKFNINNKQKFQNDIFKIVSQIYSKDLKLVNGARNFIKNSNKNHFIGSNSNKDRIINGLEIVKLSNLFPSSKIYSFDMVENPKPHPDIYLKVIDDNNLKINQTIVLEDSGVGIKAAKSAGLLVFGLTAGKHWHSNRDKNELYDNGALNVFANYNEIEIVLNGL